MGCLQEAQLPLSRGPLPRFNYLYVETGFIQFALHIPRFDLVLEYLITTSSNRTVGIRRRISFIILCQTATNRKTGTYI